MTIFLDKIYGEFWSILDVDFPCAPPGSHPSRVEPRRGGKNASGHSLSRLEASLKIPDIVREKSKIMKISNFLCQEKTFPY